MAVQFEKWTPEQTDTVRAMCASVGVAFNPADHSVTDGGLIALFAGIRVGINGAFQRVAGFPVLTAAVPRG